MMGTRNSYKVRSILSLKHRLCHAEIVRIRIINSGLVKGMILVCPNSKKVFGISDIRSSALALFVQLAITSIFVLNTAYDN
jgi:hypothetical protein